jgi:hypothetical protein
VIPEKTRKAIRSSVEREPFTGVYPPAFIGAKEVIMAKEKHDQGIVLDEKSQEQPKDKKRAQSVAKTEDKDDELQPVREKSGF